MTSMTLFRPSHRGGNHGFSTPELLIVLLIGLVATTIALPNMLTVIANARLRGNISTLSGAFQNCRALAVKTNRTMTTHFMTEGNGIKAYVKLATDTAPPVATDTQVQLEAPIVRLTTPTGAGAPAAISTAVLGFTPQTGDASFNSRGLPCAYAAGACPNQGFVYYFKDTRRSGSTGWAAVSVSPAGRIKRWFWNGSAWAE
jgi:Tfp pilus assembly protein FimT